MGERRVKYTHNKYVNIENTWSVVNAVLITECAIAEATDMENEQRQLNTNIVYNETNKGKIGRITRSHHNGPSRIGIQLHKKWLSQMLTENGRSSARSSSRVPSSVQTLLIAVLVPLKNTPMTNELRT